MKKLYKSSITYLFVLLLCFSFLEGTDKSAQASSSEKVIVGGATIGIKVNLDGLLVVGESDILSGGKKICPGKSAGIEKGDRIVEINGQRITDVEGFCEQIQQSLGEEITLGIARGKKGFKKTITPVLYDETGEYKLGIWVRDSSAGIGTITYVKSDGTFAALGHGISDVDTGQLICVKDGRVLGSKITGVSKGMAGAPGDLKGSFDLSFEGEIYENTSKGIYGQLSKNALEGLQVEVASKGEIQTGAAKVYSSVDGGKVEAFDIEIERIFLFGNGGGKNMVVKITDPRLIEKTGGIVQGMSGSPIIQNGKLVGAVTHVFVNDPTRGYGIFIENMMEEENKYT